jgi:hypothetical protein
MKHRIRSTAGPAVAVLAAGVALAGCSSGSTPSSAVSSAAAAVRSKASELASEASSAVGGLASSAQSALASAEAAASSAVAGVQGGLDAKADVTLGTAVTDADGKTDVPVTVVNHDSQPRTYTIQVDFKDASGNRLDVSVLTVPEVAAGATAQATATSNRKLTGDVKVSVGAALRY